MKLGLFIALLLASISPTIEFLSVAPAKLRTLRRILHWELAGVVVILLCAALMARGVGHFGT